MLAVSVRKKELGYTGSKKTSNDHHTTGGLTATADT